MQILSTLKTMYGLDKSHNLVDESTSRELNYCLFFNKENSLETLSFSIRCNLLLNLSNDDALTKYLWRSFLLWFNHHHVLKTTENQSLETQHARLDKGNRNSFLET